jgi:hypothetical protein
MSEQNCSCDSLEKLEGASVRAYICAYLEEVGQASYQEKNRYRCRVCGQEWKKRIPITKSQGRRPALVRVNSSHILKPASR